MLLIVWASGLWRNAWRRNAWRRDTRRRNALRLLRPTCHVQAIFMNDTERNLTKAVATLRSGGVIAYPTEAVFGLGCDPYNEAAVACVFELKQRPPTQGVLLIGGDFAQVEKYIDLTRLPAEALARVRASWPG